MTIGDLRASLANFDADHDAVVLAEGNVATIVEVVAVPGGDFTILRGKNAQPLSPRKFTINEQGLIGRLVRLGCGNDKIAEILGRELKSVQRMRKTLGF